VWGMASHVAGEGEGATVRKVVTLAVEIVGKSQLVVQAQKEAVNASECALHQIFFLHGLGFMSTGCSF
jgi:hypothetical protein